MIFRQLFDPESCSYTYLIARRRAGEAVLIDPVLEQVPTYLRLLREFELKLVQAIDTHMHADHVTGLGVLRRSTGCVATMGEQTRCEMVNVRLRDGERVHVDGMTLEAIHTPGHTRDSYSFILDDRVFTGDTLLIGGTGRTDLDGGDPASQYDSVFNRLLKLDDETLVFPGHDYKGRRVSKIAEERACNPRLQVTSRDQYVDLMNGLNLPLPRQFDIAIPANLKLGLSAERAPSPDPAI